MKLIIHDGKQGKIAELGSDELVLNGMDDFLDLIGNANYLGAEKVIINRYNVIPEFFDLKTAIAGDILQKFSTYSLKLAIIGDFSDLKSKSFKDFLGESNRIGRILFVHSKEEALERFGLV